MEKYFDELGLNQETRGTYMARLKNTKTHNIFLIDKNKLLAISGTPAPSIADTLAMLMSSDEGYKLQVLKPDVNTSGFSVCLYFRGDDNYQSKFASFCKSFVAEDQAAVNFYPRSASSVLFIWNSTHIYAVTTGQGFRMIEGYSFPKFGLIVASIFEERFKITSLDSNAMSSIIHSTKTVYSNEIDFIDVSALDTVFKEVTGRLKDASKVKALLNLATTSKKQSMKVTAKNFVQFSSALNFDGLLHLLTIIDGYDFESFRDRFNLIAPLNVKKDKSVISTNNDAVIKTMYTAINSGKEVPFDLFHENITAYISADSYVFYDPASGIEYASFDDYADPGTILTAFTAYLAGNSSTPAAFSTFARSVSIRADKGDISGITDAPLLHHISGEIQVAGVNYFIFYGKYYHLSTSYTDRLNDSLSGKLRREFYTSELKTQWAAGKDEDWFNETVSTQEDYIHLHKVKPDFIEFADLLKFENDVVTVVHVKDGFDCDMRALDRQVELSITKIMDIKHYNNGSYLRALYAKASAHDVGKNITTVFSTADEFLACVKDKPIRYIIAIRPANKILLNNTSNIAKHCLNALILRCFQQGIELRIQVLYN